MITEKELNDAIIKCLNEKNPDVRTCQKLASYFIIKEKLYDGVFENQYSRDDILYSSDTEFGKILATKNINDILMVVDELTETVKVFEPKLYKAFIKQVANLK